MRTRIAGFYSSVKSTKSGAYYSSASPKVTYPRQRQIRDPITGFLIMVPDPKDFFYFPPSRESLYEVASELGTKNTRDSWNQFEHYKRTNWYNTSPTTNGTYLLLGSGAYYDQIDIIDPASLYSESAFGPQTMPSYGLPVLLNGANGKLINPPASLNTLVSNSLRAMLPGIKPQLSLVNSIIELKDFKKLPLTIKRVMSMVKRSTTLRKILGGSADAYLQKEFNIMPLLSDISGFRKALINTSKQVENLLALEGKRLTRHYYAGLEAVYPNVSLTPAPSSYQCLAKIGSSSSPPGSSPVVNGTFKPYREVTHSKAQFHAEIQYSYYLTQFQRENAKILGLADALGVNLNPSIIWNALPWSFVVDWVVDVSRWLSQFKVGNLEPVTVIHRYMWSQEVIRNIKIDIECNLGIATLPKPLVRASYCQESAYKRDSYPITLSNITTSGFSLKEFTLAGALGLSRMH